MTYNDCITKLQELFNKMSDLSIKLTTAKNERIKLVKELNKYEKSKIDYNNTYKTIKNDDVVDLKDFIEARDNKTKIEGLFESSKIAKVVLDSNINKMQKEMDSLKSCYKEIETLQNNISKNVIDFGS